MMEHETRFTLRKIVAMYALETTGDYSKQELAFIFGLHRHTVSSLMSDEGAKRLDGKTVDKVKAVCAEKKIQITLADFEMLVPIDKT